MADTLVRPWWRGLTGDHIYERCPGRLRSLLTLVKAGLDQASTIWELDPEGTDVCGWCRRVWRARNRPEAGAPLGEVST
jgi:hypothetical protein